MGPKPPARLRAQREKGEPDEQQKWGGDSLEEANGFDPAQNDQNVEEPEEEKADCRAVVKTRPRGSEGYNHGVDGLAADPSLDAEPAASDEGAQDRGNIGAENAKRSAPQKTGNGMPYCAPAWALSSMGINTSTLPRKTVEERLPPIHAAGDHAAGEQCTWDVHAHGDPQSGVVCIVRQVRRSLATGARFLIIERTAFDGFRAKQFSRAASEFSPERVRVISP